MKMVNSRSVERCHHCGIKGANSLWKAGYYTCNNCGRHFVGSVNRTLDKGRKKGHFRYDSCDCDYCTFVWVGERDNITHSERFEK